MSSKTLKIEDGPEWDFAISMRGVQLTLISPLEISEDIPAAPVPTQEQIDRQLKRWPGLWVWLWRALFGGQSFNRDDLPTDGGAEHTRSVVIKMVGEHHREFIESITTGECAQIFATYMGLQGQWLDAISRHAEEYAQKKYGHIGASMATPDTKSASIGEQLVPGAPLPSILNPRMNPNVIDNRPDSDGGQN